MFRSAAVAFAATTLIACTKTSPAFEAFTPFADALAKNRNEAARSIGEPELQFEVEATASDPEPGKVQHLLADPGLVGYVAWTRYKLESQTKTDDGAVLRVLADVCRTAREGDACTRPAQLRYRVAMKEAEGTWKVSGMTTEVIFDPRG